MSSKSLKKKVKKMKLIETRNVEDVRIVMNYEVKRRVDFRVWTIMLDGLNIKISDYNNEAMEMAAVKETMG